MAFKAALSMVRNFIQELCGFGAIPVRKKKKNTKGGIRCISRYSAICASQRSHYPAISTGSNLPPGRNLEGQGISFAAVEVATRDERRKEQGFWPFGPTDEPAASFDNSGWFSDFGGAPKEETGGSAFDINKGHHRYPANVDPCFGNGGLAPLRLAHLRQLPVQPSCIDEHQRAAGNF